MIYIQINMFGGYRSLLFIRFQKIVYWKSTLKSSYLIDAALGVDCPSKTLRLSFYMWWKWTKNGNVIHWIAFEILQWKPVYWSSFDSMKGPSNFERTFLLLWNMVETSGTALKSVKTNYLEKANFWSLTFQRRRQENHRMGAEQSHEVVN